MCVMLFLFVFEVEGEEPGLWREPGVHRRAARRHLPGRGGVPRHLGHHGGPAPTATAEVTAASREEAPAGHTRLSCGFLRLGVGTPSNTLLVCPPLRSVVLFPSLCLFPSSELEKSI